MAGQEMSCRHALMLLSVAHLTLVHRLAENELTFGAFATPVLKPQSRARRPKHQTEKTTVTQKDLKTSMMMMTTMSLEMTYC